MQPSGDPKPNSAAQTEAAQTEAVQIEVALRDLIWRVEHVRLLLQLVTTEAMVAGHVEPRSRPGTAAAA